MSRRVGYLRLVPELSNAPPLESVAAQWALRPLTFAAWMAEGSAGGEGGASPKAICLITETRCATSKTRMSS